MKPKPKAVRFFHQVVKLSDWPVMLHFGYITELLEEIFFNGPHPRPHKAETQSICKSLKKTPESPLDCKEIKLSIQKEINPEYSLEGLMLRLKLHYFGHLIRRPESLEKTLMLRKDEGRRRRGWQRMRCWMASLIQWTWIWASSGRWWRTGKPGVLHPMT